MTINKIGLFYFAPDANAKSVDSCRRVNVLPRVLLSLIAILLLAATGTADELQLSLKSGSLLTVDVENQSLDWTNVMENGDMSSRQIPLKQLSKLYFSESPASLQVAKARKLIQLLGSENYSEREDAEKKLSQPSIGGAFKSLIESQSNHPSLETRYRIERILYELDGRSTDVESEFDILTLQDGTQLEGDAGQTIIRCQYRGKPFEFNRNQIVQISRISGQPKFQSKTGAVRVTLHHDHQNEFHQETQRVVDFERTPTGRRLENKSNVNDSFIPWGIKMATEKPGYVGISGYGFKFPELPPRANSICSFLNAGNFARRFRGVMEFRFCVPDRPTVPAGVKEFGLFIARVNHSRDIIVEAYNADGQMLACVEATDKNCIFSGVKSNELISFVRILSNPHLFRVDRTIDDDFAVDCVNFSPPIEILTPIENEKPSLRLKNGDLVVGEVLKVANEKVSIRSDTTMEFDLDEIQLIQFPNPKSERSVPSNPAAAKDSLPWAVRLPDRSVIFVTPGQEFQSVDFDSLSIKRSQIEAIWQSKNPLRYPVAGDFDQGENVLVFPTCRIADKVAINQQGFQWAEDATKIQQPLFTGREKEGDEDPSPQINSIAFAKAWPDNVPSLWLRKPNLQNPDCGMIRLHDGQQFGFGSSGTFQLESISNQSVLLQWMGNRIEIPTSDIKIVEFPREVL
ncbi:MAG: hypothetical protein AAF939_08740 [Planctomycetota bacterium]